MKRARILHVEDHPEWIQHVKYLLKDEYDMHSVSSMDEAEQLFMDLANQNLRIDLAIIDISLVVGDASDRQGFDFIQTLEKTCVLNGSSIIILTGYPEVDDNMRVAFRNYNVLDVFDKATFVEEREQFKKQIREAIEKMQET